MEAKELREQLKAIEEKEVQTATAELQEFLMAWMEKHNCILINELGLIKSEGQHVGFVVVKK